MEVLGHLAPTFTRLGQRKERLHIFFPFVYLQEGFFGGVFLPFEVLNRTYFDTFLESLGLDWLVGFGFNGPLRQYFSLYRAVSQRVGGRGKKG